MLDNKILNYIKLFIKHFSFALVKRLNNNIRFDNI